MIPPGPMFLGIVYVDFSTGNVDVVVNQRREAAEVSVGNLTNVAAGARFRNLVVLEVAVILRPKSFADFQPDVSWSGRRRGIMEKCFPPLLFGCYCSKIYIWSDPNADFHKPVVITQVEEQLVVDLSQLARDLTVVGSIPDYTNLFQSTYQS